MTFTLLRAQRDLAAMGRRFGEDVGDIEQWIAELEAGAETLWNPDIGAYDSRDVHGGAFNGVLSNASALCWYAGLRDDRARPAIVRMLEAAKYGLASYDPQAVGFEPLRYWRGPTWPVMNYLVGSGMEEQGEHEMAARIRADTARLIAANGFAEYYDPIMATPAGGDAFTWTAAVWLGWASTTPQSKQGAA